MHLILGLILIGVVIRMLRRPYWYGPRRYGDYRNWNGYGYGYGCGYGYGRPRFGGVLSVLALVALARMFGRRW
jgi:hypothetical protein